jgi:hypothetical protein
MGLFYQSGIGTLNLFGSYASDAAFVAANGTAVNGYAYYNTTLNAFRAYGNSGWRTLYGPLQVSGSKTTTYPISIDDDFVRCDATSAGFTITLPTAVGNAGKVWQLKKTDSSFNQITVATTSAQTVDGAASTKLSTQNETLTVMSDGTNLQILSRRIPSIATAFTPTGSWTSNTTYTGFWKRIGDSAQVRVRLTLSGAPTSTSLTAVLGPTGLTFDTSKMPTLSADGALGWASIFRGGDKALGSIQYAGSGTGVDVYYDFGDGTAARVTQAAPGTFASGDFIWFEYILPISGWEG